MTHETLLTWICDVLLTQSLPATPVKILVYLWNVGPSRFLVKMSASLVVPAIHLIPSIPASFCSHRNTDWTSLCLIVPPMPQLLAKYTAPWLSISRTIGSLTLSSSDSRIFLIQSMSCTQATPTYISASVVDNDTDLSVLLPPCWHWSTHGFYTKNNSI
jgi:hypothetical protein